MAGKIRRRAAAVGALLACLSAGPAWSQHDADPPLPVKTRVVPPGADVPRPLAAFSGVWRGRWGNVLPSILVVEQVASSGAARVVYAWGENSELRTSAGSVEVRATIASGVLSFGQNPRFEFTMERGSTLFGRRYHNGEQDGRITMTRAPMPALKAVQPARRRMCILEESPFALSEGNRLGEPDMLHSFSGKRFVMVRRHIDGDRFIRVARVMRPDGSAAWLCERGSSANGPWSPCPLVADGPFMLEGNREIGLWNLAGGALCFTNSRGTSACFAMHREGSRYYARQLSGAPSCTEGPISVQ